MIIQNKGYASGLALDRQIVRYVSRRWLWGFLLYENLLLVLLDHLLVLLLSDGHELQLVLYMHPMMMQHLVFWQQQLLK